MFFLAGLLGMMVIGSVAVISTAEPEEDMPEDDDGMAPVMLDGQQADVAGYKDIAAGGSLFAQMGLINSGGVVTAGDERAEQISGTAVSDLIDGAGGDDLIEGFGDDDLLHGGGGDDTITGGTDNDTLHGDAGADRMLGGNDADLMFGHDGDDTIAGQVGDDEIWGGLGNDLLDGGLGDDALMGREGMDDLRGGLGEDTLFAGDGADLVNGVVLGADGADMDGLDYLNGADGADTLTIGSGDVATGGAGADQMVLGDWITGASSELMDFDAAEDQLVVLYDDSADETPDLELRLDPTDSDLTEIVLNGAVISVLPTEDAPSLNAIVLMGESVAAALESA